MKKKKPNKKDAILHATLALVAERGFHGTPAAEIASRAGVGIGTIYRYFESKDVLITAVMRDIEDRLSEKLLKQGYLSDGSARQRFMHIVRGILVYNIENQKDFRFIEQFMNSPYGAEYRSDRIFGKEVSGDIGLTLKDIFMEGISRGEVKDLPLPMLHALTFGPVTLTIRDHILGLMKMNDELIDVTVSACWDAVSTRK